MRRFTALLLAALMLLSLAACGQGASAGGSAQNAAGDPTPEEEAPELPEPEPYEISDPTVMPEGGVRDGVTYAAYDGIVEHLFFHPVVAYPELAFDGDAQANGIDDYMVTVDEYNKILQSVYDKGYVLVDIGDVWSETTGEDGQPKMVRNTLYLPEGKKPLILSYDDTNYYEYMLANGFTYKLVIGEDGKIASWGKDPQGNEVTSRDLDAIPILDKFVEEHPDFSPFGAKGCLSLTGYQGILGYRTDSAYNTDEYKAEHPDFNFEEERANAAKVVQCLRDDGFEIASHSWGHRNMGTIPMDKFREDTDKWANEVETLTGPCDIILFPFGSDIGDWHPYDTSSERFQYLYNKGFRYFCNVDSSQYFVQIGDDYMRQGRRNLDGYRMYYDLPESGVGGDHLSDLFDVNEVFDRSRPTPVPKMTE